MGVIPPAITTPLCAPLIKITLEMIVPKILKNNFIVSNALGSPLIAFSPIIGAFKFSKGLLCLKQINSYISSIPDPLTIRSLET